MFDEDRNPAVAALEMAMDNCVFLDRFRRGSLAKQPGAVIEWLPDERRLALTGLRAEDIPVPRRDWLDESPEVRWRKELSVELMVFDRRMGRR